MRFSATLLSCALVAVPFCASAQVSININIPGLVAVAPPPPRMEPLPPPRAGYIWVPGNWRYRENAYAWHQGYWQPARADYDYAPGRWVRADGGWRWVEPNWKPVKYKKDRDHGHHDHEHDRGHDHDRYDDAYHCPPGQAKKGRC